jgi:hypothetical protein
MATKSTKSNKSTKPSAAKKSKPVAAKPVAKVAAKPLAKARPVAKAPELTKGQLAAFKAWKTIRANRAAAAAELAAKSNKRGTKAA